MKLRLGHVHLKWRAKTVFLLSCYAMFLMTAFIILFHPLVKSLHDSFNDNCHDGSLPPLAKAELSLLDADSGGDDGCPICEFFNSATNFQLDFPDTRIHILPPPGSFTHFLDRHRRKSIAAMRSVDGDLSNTLHLMVGDLFIFFCDFPGEFGHNYPLLMGQIFGVDRLTFITRQ